MGISKTLRMISTCLMCFFSFSLGIVALWMLLNPNMDCLSSLGWPFTILIVVLILNVINLILSSLGLGGKIPPKLFPWILVFMSFVLVAFFVVIYVLASIKETQPDEQTTTGRSVRPDLPTSLPDEALAKLESNTYTLADLKSFLTKDVRNSKIWGKMKKCIKELANCEEVNRGITTLDDLYLTNLSPIQVGCCMPPVTCGFTPVITPVGIVGWAKGNIDNNYYLSSPDCSTWNNNANLYCYACDSCRASYLVTVKGAPWLKFALVGMILVAVALILSIIVLCMEYKTKKTEPLTK